MSDNLHPIAAARLATDELTLIATNAAVATFATAVARAVLLQQEALEALAAPKPAPVKKPVPSETYSERVTFGLLKALALRSIREQLKGDPENCITPEVAKRLEAVTTIDELDTVLDTDVAHDWLPIFIEERSVELLTDLLATLPEEVTTP